MPNTVETPLGSLPLIDLLRELALDLGFEWNRYNDDIWRGLDSEVWRITRNPWLMLQEASARKLRAMADDANLRHRVEQLVRERRDRSQMPHWFDKTHGGAALKQVAYFSMEFGLSEALPIYSGGLGNVAGDQLKAGDDLGVPIVGVGLLYQQGYSRQAIDHGGHQRDLFPYNPPAWLPINPVRDSDGEVLRIRLDFPDYHLQLRVWEAKVGRLKLYLLDSNDPGNIPMMRGITSELYGGNAELRLQQEAVLGIGGWRLLSALGYKPDVCHLNEGHASFAVLDRALSFMHEHNVPFPLALTATRPGNLFTTHTPVAAGFDRFSPALMNLYLGRYAAEELHISFKELMALGRLNPDDPNEHFNMAYLAVRGAGAVNGVSQLHGEVSRSIFQPLFPRWPTDEVPIGSLTNGVHVVSWESEFAGRLWADACGEDRWHAVTEKMGDKIRAVSDERLWELRCNNAQEFVRFVRLRAERQRAAYGASLDELQLAKTMFDPNALIVGFARRFATYKRPNLLLQDPERLARILTNRQYPVQLVVAGKAHPQDQPGKDMIQQWIQFIRRPDIHEQAIFLVDYDLLLAQRIVQGVDVWINNPRRPWEACGTSGMKVLVNGGLNLSALDGWWAEAYTADVGWALGDGKEHEDGTASWDALDGQQLFDILENDVIPKFYCRDDHGLPREWIAMKRESMARLTAQFSANRAVREYTERYYLSAATRFHERAVAQGTRARAIELWRDWIDKNWAKLNFGSVRVETIGDFHEFRVQVYLGELKPDAVAVELYAAARDGAAAFHQPATLTEPLLGTVGGFVYTAQVPSSRPTGDYTPRILPSTEGVSVPLEEPRILWQR
jgi:starch phosphorylase